MADADDVRAAYEKYLTSFVANDMAGIDSVVSYPLAYIGDGRVQMFEASAVITSALVSTLRR